MKEYYKEDNELGKQRLDYFSPDGYGKTPRKEFEIGGKKWYAYQTGWENNTDGSIPEDRRIEGEVILHQVDGTRYPTIRLDISVDHGIE